MSEVLINVTRGPVVESMHRGDAVAVDNKGKILYQIGDPYKVTYLRSSAKPLQTINVFLSGAVDKYKFDDSEISIMCASHYCEDFHLKVIDSMLEKLGLNLNNLDCGSIYSISPKHYERQLKENHVLTQANNDCSGKHCGMLASCLVKGYSLENYTKFEHELQKDILTSLSYMCEIEPDKISIGVDGCTVPVHAMPIYNMALGFAKLANPENLDSDYKAACERIFDAMNNSPEMVSGTDGFCTELIRHTNGKLVGKLGAEGIYCIGIKGKNIGLAVKIEDGNYSRAINPAVMKCLEDMQVLEPSELENLKSFSKVSNYNNKNEVIGYIEPCFEFNKI